MNMHIKLMNILVNWLIGWSSWSTKYCAFVDICLTVPTVVGRLAQLMSFCTLAASHCPAWDSQSTKWQQAEQSQCAATGSTNQWSWNTMQSTIIKINVQNRSNYSLVIGSITRHREQISKNEILCSRTLPVCQCTSKFQVILSFLCGFVHQYLLAIFTHLPRCSLMLQNLHPKFFACCLLELFSVTV